MARTSPAATVAEVYAQLNGIITGVAETYDHEPASFAGPLTISVSYAGQTPTEWLIRVRVYATAAADFGEAQTRLMASVPLVAAALDGHYGPDSWTSEFVERGEGGAASLFMATCILEVGRE